ncbi:helix-turn-helix domain-containing protein [Sphingomonas sp. Leaf343]|uniref:helix-turn-helix domain-containing protein n=1 Tax=Sphingomonas sp. Leaf343 TaxID=1736345 RepID=UPI00144481B1|nr:helix-turn-helix domain-containing protein [Sphingomonas sp. Leaf343]
MHEEQPGRETRDTRTFAGSTIGDGSPDPARWRPQTHFRHAVTTGGQLELLNEAGGIAVDFEPLPQSPIHFAFAGSQSETLSIWTTRSDHGFISRPKISADLITLRFVRTGFMLRDDAHGDGTVVGFDQALCVSFDAMRREQASPGFSATTATMSRDAIVHACRTLSGSEAAILPQFRPVVETGNAGLAALRQTLNILWYQLGQRRDDDLMIPLLEELLVYQFVSAWPSIGTTIAPNPVDVSIRPIKTALDFIEGNLRRTLSISDIAAAAGLTARALQTGFKRHVGCSPVQHLIARRLDRVHAALQTDDDLSVAQAASTWGFAHMSDFSRRYRERYGCLPSDTRRRSKV